MFGLPIGLIVRFVAAIAIALACWYVYERVEHWCNAACREETAKAVKLKADWDAAVAAQQKREAAAAAAADDFQRRADAKRTADFNALLARRTAERNAALASERVGAATLDELRNTVRAANGSSPGKSEESSTTPAGTTDGGSLNNWFAGIAKLYDECRDTVIGWIKWDDDRLKGVTQ